MEKCNVRAIQCLVFICTASPDGDLESEKENILLFCCFFFFKKYVCLIFARYMSQYMHITCSPHFITKREGRAVFHNNLS